MHTVSIYTCVYIYIHIERERERERAGVYIYIYIYIHTYIYIYIYNVSDWYVPSGIYGLLGQGLELGFRAQVSGGLGWFGV